MKPANARACSKIVRQPEELRQELVKTRCDNKVNTNQTTLENPDD